MILEQIIDSFSIMSLLTASFLFFYILIKYYKGMRTPPFWIYIFAGFLVITFVNILTTVWTMVGELILRIIILIGYLLFLIGVVELFKSYRSRIKFDKK